MCIVNTAWGCSHEEASYEFLDDLDYISVLPDKHDDLENEIIHLLNEVSIFIQL